MSMLSNLDLIRRVPLFANLEPELAEVLAAAAEKRRYKRGESLVKQNTHSDALYVLLAGRARVLMTDPKGREVILATLHAGDYVGEMSLVDRNPHSATVTTEVQSDVLVLGHHEVTRCLQESKTLALSFLGGMVQRLRNADQKISSLALMGVYGRVATVLLDHAVADDKGELIIREKLSRLDIAKMVGASREMVTRVMRDFEEQGFIETLDDGSVRVIERRMLPK